MFVVKLKYKKSLQVYYCNKIVKADIQEVRKEHSNFPLPQFCVSLKQAKEVFKDLLFKYKNLEEEYLDYGKPEYIAIVELSNYAPYSEYQVLEYFDRF